MFNRILLCSDGSDHAAKAAALVAEIAERFGSRVTLLSVYMPPPSIMPMPGAGGLAYVDLSAEVGGEVEEAVHKQMEADCGRILSEKKIEFQLSRERGQPVDRIITVAQESDADLIVLGSRGLGGFGRLLLGSVSDGVTHHAECPVLVAR